MQKRYGLIFLYTLPLWLAGLFVYLLHVLNPVSSGPWGIMVVFLTFYLLVASVIFTLLHVGLKVIAWLLAKRGAISTRAYRMSARRAYYVASVLAFGPVMLLALQSVRQLAATDVLLVGIFLLLAGFYVSKKTL